MKNFFRKLLHWRFMREFKKVKQNILYNVAVGQLNNEDELKLLDYLDYAKTHLGITGLIKKN